MQKEWFSDWFGSPYYPILYGNRNETEAQQFIQKITKHLGLPFRAKILDLACGRGRYAIQLNHLGYDVRGWDISTESIAKAKQYENAYLQFSVLDMRQDFLEKDFDAIFNFFTSFGYFDKLAENQIVLEHIANALHENGKWVLDFFSPDYVRKILIPFEIKTLQNIEFHIRKHIKDGFVYKHIHIIDGEKTLDFVEKVQLIELSAFQEMFVQAGLKVQEIWGEYDGTAFDAKNSSRLIFIGKK